MPRAKNNVARNARTKKVLKLAKGNFGRRKNLYSIAKQSAMRAGMFAFAHRKRKKGEFRRLWHARINAAVRKVDASLNYSRFTHLLSLSGVGLNRKSLAYLATHDEAVFEKVVDEVKNASSGEK